jgi:hypothetical protein
LTALGGHEPNKNAKETIRLLRPDYLTGRLRISPAFARCGFHFLAFAISLSEHPLSIRGVVI